MQAGPKLRFSYIVGRCTKWLHVEPKYSCRLISQIVSTIAAFILTVSAVSYAHADACSALRSQLRTVGRSVNANPEAAQLARQLAAIRALERKRQCSATRDRGGLFNPCADLAKRRAAVQRQIGQVSRRGSAGPDDAAAIRARIAALGCAASPGRQRTARAAPAPAMLFCVRLSDGYLFPSPHSQFVGEDDYKATLDRCRFICGEEGMDVYTLEDVSRETEEMVSVETRKPYTELPSAFAYREATAFRACDLQRYYRRVEEARARSVTPFKMTHVVIPVPTPRPDMSTFASISGGPSEAAPASAEPAKRRVRLVGPAFLPAE